MVKEFVGSGIKKPLLFKQLYHRDTGRSIYFVAIAKVEHQVKLVILFVTLTDMIDRGSVVVDGNGLPLPLHIQFIKGLGILGDALGEIVVIVNVGVVGFQVWGKHPHIKLVQRNSGKK